MKRLLLLREEAGEWRAPKEKTNVQARIIISFGAYSSCREGSAAAGPFGRSQLQEGKSDFILLGDRHQLGYN